MIILESIKLHMHNVVYSPIERSLSYVIVIMYPSMNSHKYAATWLTI